MLSVLVGVRGRQTARGRRAQRASKMNRSRTGPDDALRALLLAGPMDSRSALAAMAARGFSSKQVRRAREKLRIACERSGYGPASKTTWALPAAAASVPVSAAPVVPTVEVRSDVVAKGSTPRATSDGLEHTGERLRTERRGALFVTRGMNREVSTPK